MRSPARFVLDLRHRTCQYVPREEPAPAMILERAEDDMGIYACPACNHKVSVLLFFEAIPASPESGEDKS